MLHNPRLITSALISTYLEAVVRPGAELHEAGLLVEREVPYIDFARGFEDGRRCPHYFSVVVQDGFGHCRHHVLSVSAVCSD